MKPFFAVALLASVSGVALFASGQTTTGATDSDKAKPAEEEVRRLSGEEVKAFMHRDPQAMERLWSDDFVVTNPLNRFVTK